MCCDLPVSSCGRTAERAATTTLAARTAAWLSHDGVVTAEYPGVCAACREPVDVGDPIRHARPGDRFGDWRGLLCCGGSP